MHCAEDLQATARLYVEETLIVAYHENTVAMLVEESLDQNTVRQKLHVHFMYVCDWVALSSLHEEFRLLSLDPYAQPLANLCC